LKGDSYQRFPLENLPSSRLFHHRTLYGMTDRYIQLTSPWLRWIGRFHSNFWYLWRLFFVFVVTIPYP